MKQYCPVCGCEQEMKILQREETYPVKGEPITIMANVCVCAECGEEIISIQYDDENLRKAYEQYRIRHGLLQPHEIKTIREKYGISQVNFARIIGVGDKTIARYENGSLQDEAINNLIMLSRDPKNFMMLLDKNQHVVSHEEAYRLKMSCLQMEIPTMWGGRQSEYTYDYLIEDRALLLY